jgi:hypothetical protein
MRAYSDEISLSGGGDVGHRTRVDPIAIMVYIEMSGLVWFGLFDLRPCQRDNGYLDGRSQIKVHTDERTQVHSAQSSLY